MVGLHARLRLPRTSEPDSDPTVQRLIRESRQAQSRPLKGRERTAVLMTALAFLAAAVAFAVLGEGGRPFEPAVAAALLGLYVFAARVEFHTGSGWTVPTQVVF